MRVDLLVDAGACFGVTAGSSSIREIIDVKLSSSSSVSSVSEPTYWVVVVVDSFV